MHVSRSFFSLNFATVLWYNCTLTWSRHHLYLLVILIIIIMIRMKNNNVLHVHSSLRKWFKLPNKIKSFTCCHWILSSHTNVHHLHSSVFWRFCTVCRFCFFLKWETAIIHTDICLLDCADNSVFLLNIWF